MTQEETLEYNKRCAEFLNFKNHGEYWTTTLFGGGGVSLREMKFHFDWKWIIEIVEAIEKVNFTELPGFSCFSFVIKDSMCSIEQHPQFALAFEELSDSFHNHNSYVIAESKKKR